jgi:GT2 family glycosyltransferase
LHRALPLRYLREWDWMGSFAHDRPLRVDMVSGACWMLRRAMIARIGPLNDNLFLYGEEFDLCWRAASAGWETWFVPAGPVVHAGGRSSGAHGSNGVLTSFHRYRSSYLTMRWHRGIGRAVLAAILDQAVLHLRYCKSRLRRAEPPARRTALATAIAESRRAAMEMIRWRQTGRSHAT